MTQNDVIKQIAEKTGISPAKVKEVLTAQAELATTHLKTNDEFHLHGFGKLKAKTSSERKGRNPSTGEEITVKASRNVRLATGKGFKDGLQ